jgi:hypothetical protein
MAYRSYPGGSSMAGGLPAHVRPIVAVNTDWVRANGNRSQRRRIEQELKRQKSKKAAAK